AIVGVIKILRGARLRTLEVGYIGDRRIEGLVSIGGNTIAAAGAIAAGEFGVAHERQQVLEPLFLGKDPPRSHRTKIAELTAGTKIARSIPSARKRKDIFPVVNIFQPREKRVILVEIALILYIYRRRAIDGAEEIVVRITGPLDLVVVLRVLLIGRAGQRAEHAIPDRGVIVDLRFDGDGFIGIVGKRRLTVYKLRVLSGRWISLEFGRGIAVVSGINGEAETGHYFISHPQRGVQIIGLHEVRLFQKRIQGLEIAQIDAFVAPDEIALRIQQVRGIGGQQDACHTAPGGVVVVVAIIRSEIHGEPVVMRHVVKISMQSQPLIGKTAGVDVITPGESTRDEKSIVVAAAG